MACSAVFILDSHGKVLISRDYRGDLSTKLADRFVSKLTEDESEGVTERPVIHRDGVTYMYIKHNGLYILAIAKNNADAAVVLLALYRLVEIFQEYFKELNEESLRDNFVIVYELMDEALDFGYPQVTESKILQEYITQQSFKQETKAEQPRPPIAATGAVSWRQEGIKYRKNEVFLDVIEKVNLLVSSSGHVLRSEIVGAVHMKTFLTGMPELKLGLNDKVMFEQAGRAGSTKSKLVDLDDVKFHQCVRLSKFEHDRTISFVPPDGEFDLLTYRLNTNVKPLFWIDSVVESHAHSRVEYMIKAKSQFKAKSTAVNVEIVIPVHPDAATPKFRKSANGTVRYAPELNAIVWTIKQFPGRKEFMLKASFSLPSITDEESRQERPPISVKFEIPYFTVSGISVRYLKILEKSGYQALPWVRYITMNGDYQIRM